MSTAASSSPPTLDPQEISAEPQVTPPDSSDQPGVSGVSGVSGGCEETHIREIPGGAGHGPARAYGYIALASAFGASASLTRGGTRSTSRNPLQVTVTCDSATFASLGSLYDEVAEVAERVAAEKRAEARKSGRLHGSGYQVSLLTRAVLAGFPQGVASALRQPGTTRPAPFREATRARLSDETAHRSAVASGRAWALRSLPEAQAVSHGPDEAASRVAVTAAPEQDLLESPEASPGS